MKPFKQKLSWLRAKGLAYAVIVAVVIVSGLLPAVMPRGASALQLTVRSLTLSSGVPSKTGTTWTYGFTTATSAAIQSIKFVVCTTAVGTTGLASTNATTGCTAPGTGNLVNQGTQQGTVGGSWTNTTGFTRTTSTTGNCAPGNNVLCITRTQAASESLAGKTVTWNTQTNPSATNTAFFVGIYIYSDAAYATPTDAGTVASATVQTLTVSAIVSEVLNFCVGSTTINDSTTALGTPDCTGVSGSSLSLGNLDPTHTNISPVSAGNGGDAKNGIAMLRTNGTGGATVSYDAVQSALGSGNVGALRINAASTTCSSSNTDPCINSMTPQTIITTGTEDFGMTIPGVNCGNGSGSTITYACSFAASTNHLTRDAAYDGNGGVNATQFTTDIDQVTGTTLNGYEWKENGAVTVIATSSGVVDDEALILKFAATTNNITPFGAYSVQADFIAVPTY